MYKYKSDCVELNLHLFKFEKKVNSEDLERFKKDFYELIIKKTPFYFIIDLFNIFNFDVSLFMTINSFIQKNKIELKKYLLGSSIIIDSNSIVFINMVMKFIKPMAPNLITSDMKTSVKFIIDIQQKLSTL